MRLKKSIIFALIFLLTFMPIFYNLKVTAATKKYIVKASVEYTIIIGEKLNLYVKSSKTAKWSTSNKKIATVTQKGVITGKKEGKIKITAQVGAKKYTCSVIVIDGKELQEKSEEFSNSYIRPELTPDTDLEKELDKEREKEAAKKKAEEEALKKRIKEMNENGSAVSGEYEEDAIYIAFDEFRKSWISEDDLKNKYNIYAARYPDKINFINLSTTNVIYTLSNVPSTLKNQEELTRDSVRLQYIDNFTLNGDSIPLDKIYFNIDDLKRLDMIK